MELLEIKDVLPIFGVKDKTFRKWIERNKVPVQDKMIVRIGNTIRIRKIILDKFLAGEM